MLKRIISTYFYRFLGLNLLTVVFAEYAIISQLNGSENPFPYNIMLISILVTLPIIGIQYILLGIKSNWFYKSFIFYLGMVVFMFLFGIIMAWNEPVGGHKAGTWIARFDSGLRTLLLGHFFGWIFLILIILVNWIASDWLFEKKSHNKA